jgi:hypothetical protein
MIAAMRPGQDPPIVLPRNRPAGGHLVFSAGLRGQTRLEGGDPGIHPAR